MFFHSSHRATLLGFYLLLGLLTFLSAEMVAKVKAQELIDFCPGPCDSNAKPYPVGGSLIVEAVEAPAGQPRISRLDPSTLVRRPLEAQPRTLEILRGNGRILFAEDSFAPQRPLVAITSTGIEDLPVGLIYGEAFSSNGNLYFSTLLPGKELWESDGTAAGTHQRLDLQPGWAHCSFPVPGCWPVPDAIVPSEDRVFFAVAQGYSYSPWVWDRTSGNFHPLAGIAKAWPLQAIPGGRVILDVVEPYSLWISDGTPDGSHALVALPDSSYISSISWIGERLFFKSSADSNFWISDLTGAGTVPLPADFSATVPTMIATWRGIFLVNHTPDGILLGISDGTPAATHFFAPSQHLPVSEAGSLFGLVDGRVVFVATDAEAGSELWISDGTSEGTYRMTDIAPGAESSLPSDFAQVGNRLFFQATNHLNGRELWVLDLPPLSPCNAEQICLTNDRFEVEVTANTSTGLFRGQRAAGSDDSVVFTFFSAENWEILVKVLDGCAINGQRWIFAAAATDVGFTLKVVDRETGAEKFYTNSNGQPAVAVTDTAAFSCNY